MRANFVGGDRPTKLTNRKKISSEKRVKKPESGAKWSRLGLGWKKLGNFEKAQNKVVSQVAAWLFVGLHALGMKVNDRISGYGER